jgi:catechol 2,3-dioxygenase-like lactoylglutathione lyase family enzyme
MSGRNLAPMYGRPDTGGLLSSQLIIACAATTQPERARAFYGFALGLMLTEDTPRALLFDAGGSMLRVEKVTHVVAPPYPILGWQVADIAGTLKALAARAVQRVPIPGTMSDKDGVWTAQTGFKYAWFRDPDGNILSLMQSPTT